MPRTETGKFYPPEESWPGVFIRGDDALYRYAPALRALWGDAPEFSDFTGMRASLYELEMIMRSCEDNTSREISRLTESQIRAVASIKTRIRYLREPNRTDTEVRAALGIEGWNREAIEVALKEVDQ